MYRIDKSTPQGDSTARQQAHSFVYSGRVEEKAEFVWKAEGGFVLLSERETSA